MILLGAEEGAEGGGGNVCGVTVLR